MNLIIVESPTKAKTIAKFLGKDYRVESSFGHIRDLPKSKLGVDLENNFKPDYVIPTKARKRVNDLKKLAQASKSVILASDEDREGEAIAWHLLEALNIDEDNYQRISFHEITKEAILQALEEPREINIKMVNAQQARRILDRLVGYKLSPLLWKKVAKGLSAGRVQSVAVRLIVEKQREIDAFVPQEYWDIEAELEKDKNKFKARLFKINNKTLDKFYFKNEASTKDVLASLGKSNWVLDKIESKESSKNPLPPFITSSLQQSANRRLGFSAKQTMMTAQKLYEMGFITYMRTDSLNLSKKFKEETASYLKDNFGEKYLAQGAAVFKNKSKNAQEAHEAIRPTSVFATPDSLREKLDKGQFSLYQLIWQRAVASQMAKAILDTVSLDIIAGEKQECLFRANGQTIKFKGYLEIYPESVSENELPPLKEKDELNLIKINKEQHFTQAPAPYSDASLVKELEKHGIGRPSTYAPTISTIIDRNYVNRDERKRLVPTEIAFVVTDLLVKHFPNLVDYKFTAQMEKNLDDIALGKKEWQPVIEDFWLPFNENLKNKYMELDKKDFAPEEESNEVCDKCGAKMIIKTGRFGKFLACSAFPECRNIKALNGQEGTKAREESQEIKDLKEKYKGEICDKCGSEMLVRMGKFGPFLGCSAYPKCRNLKNIEKDGQNEKGVPCPVCGEGMIVKKFSRRGVFYACNAYPKCKNAYFAKPNGDKCQKCGALMVETKDGVKCSNKECQ